MRRLCLLAASALLLACADGYPTEDLATGSPFEMSNPQRLAALNELGRAAQPGWRWSFTLSPDCRLAVQRREGRASPQHLAPVALTPVLEAEVFSNPATGRFDLVLLASTDPGAARLATVLESRSWTHAVQAELLLQLLVRDCGKG